MKKILWSLAILALLPVAFMGGCGNNNSGPTGPGSPTRTRTATSTPTVTMTRTMTKTATVSNTPTVTRTRTITGTPTDTNTQTVTATETGTATMTATSQAPQAAINLGSAANYVVLAYSAVTNNGTSTLCGDLGIYPLSSVDGGIVMTCGGVQDVDNTAANIAKLDLGTAYTDAAGRTGGAILPSGSDIGGLTLYPGLYTSGGDLLVSSADLTLDALGDSNAIFIFQVNGVLNATSGRQVSLTGGAKAANVYWQVTDYCSLGTTVSFAGNIMAYNSVTLNTGATLEGRALAENGNVTMLANSITKPIP